MRATARRAGDRAAQYRESLAALQAALRRARNGSDTLFGAISEPSNGFPEAPISARIAAARIARPRPPGDHANCISLPGGRRSAWSRHRLEPDLGRRSEHAPRDAPPRGLRDLARPLRPLGFAARRSTSQAPERNARMGPTAFRRRSRGSRVRRTTAVRADRGRSRPSAAQAETRAPQAARLGAEVLLRLREFVIGAGEPLRPRRRAGRRRAARPGLQPALPVRAARRRQDPPAAGDRQLRRALHHALERPLRDGRDLHQRIHWRRSSARPVAAFKQPLPRRRRAARSTTSSSSKARTRPPRSSSTPSTPLIAAAPRSCSPPTARRSRCRSSTPAAATASRAGLVVDLAAAGLRHAARRSCSKRAALTADRARATRGPRAPRRARRVQHPRARGRPDPRRAPSPR